MQPDLAFEGVEILPGVGGRLFLTLLPLDGRNPLLFAQQIEAVIGADSHDPVFERAVAPKRLSFLPGFRKALLRGVIGFTRVVEYLIAVFPDADPQPLELKREITLRVRFD